jgi:integrase
MARQSKNGHVKKICGCASWKTCTHPWYIEYFKGREAGPDGKMRKRGLRARLGPLVGREPVDFADAKGEARRAIVAWQEGRDARDLLRGDTPTLDQMLDGYAARPGGAPVDRYQRAAIAKVVVNGRRFGDWRVADITREMVEAFRRQRPLVSGNRDLALLRAAFNWAVLNELVPATPFKVGTVTAVQLHREEPRTRRLQPGEAERLLAAAGGRHRDLIVAALETGCRRGELLSLQWEQVRGDLFLPAGKTKAKKPRPIPISSVLQAVLDRRRADPAGDPHPSSAFVFGDEVGRPQTSIKTAWRAICRRANITGLTFHDLRREAGSRWMDAGVPLATIQRWLGHHNISQTSTYLAASGGGDEDAMRAFEQATGRVPDPPIPSQGVASPRLSQIVPLSGPTTPKRTSSDRAMIKNAKENHTVH